MAAPIRHSPAPPTSHRSGRRPSTAQTHPSEATMKIPAIGCIGSPGGVALYQCEQIGEGDERRYAGEQPQCWPFEPKPGPERETARDLADRRADVNDSSSAGEANRHQRADNPLL